MSVFYMYIQRHSRPLSSPIDPSIRALYTLAPARYCYSRNVQRLSSHTKARIITYQGQSDHTSCTPAPWPHTHGPPNANGYHGEKKKNFVMSHIWVGENEHGVLISRI